MLVHCFFFIISILNLCTLYIKYVNGQHSFGQTWWLWWLSWVCCFSMVHLNIKNFKDEKPWSVFHVYTSLGPKFWVAFFTVNPEYTYTKISLRLLSWWFSDQWNQTTVTQTNQMFMIWNPQPVVSEPNYSKTWTGLSAGTLAKQCSRGQMPQNTVSDQGLHCLLNLSKLRVEWNNLHCLQWQGIYPGSAGQGLRKSVQ